MPLFVHMTGCLLSPCHALIFLTLLPLIFLSLLLSQEEKKHLYVHIEVWGGSCSVVPADRLSVLYKRSYLLFTTEVWEL